MTTQENLMHVSHSYVGDTDRTYSNRWSLIRAAEVFRHSLAALVDEHLDGDGQHEVDVEGLDLDGGAKAESSVEVGNAGQQRAACIAGATADHCVQQPIEHVHARTQL